VYSDMSIRFCEGLFTNETPKNRPYVGQINSILFQSSL